MTLHADAINTSLPPIVVAAEQYDRLSAVAGGLEEVLPRSRISSIRNWRAPR